jgi:hypothetical protein
LRILLLHLLLLEEGNTFQLSLMFKLSFMDNDLKEGMFLLKSFLEDHFSHIQSIIRKIMKMLLTISLFEYTFVEQNNKLFEKKKNLSSFLVMFLFLRWPFPWATFLCLVGLCLLSLGKLAHATLFSTLYGNLYSALHGLHCVCL